ADVPRKVLPCTTMPYPPLFETIKLVMLTDDPAGAMLRLTPAVSLSSVQLAILAVTGMPDDTLIPATDPEAMQFSMLAVTAEPEPLPSRMPALPALTRTPSSTAPPLLMAMPTFVADGIDVAVIDSCDAIWLAMGLSALAMLTPLMVAFAADDVM